MAEGFVIITKAPIVQGFFIFLWGNHPGIQLIVASKSLIDGSNLIRKSTC